MELYDPCKAVRHSAAEVCFSVGLKTDNPKRQRGRTLHKTDYIVAWSDRPR